MKPYYEDESVTLYHGDCREVLAWHSLGDVLLTDPPYGRNWSQGWTAKSHGTDGHAGISGDRDTTVRDAALSLWGTQRPAIVFGDLMIPAPPDTRQVLGYRKALASGSKGTYAGFRRDLEGIFLVGPWYAGLGGESSVLSSRMQQLPQVIYKHPHAKPLDVLQTLLSRCPAGVVADPFVGSGSTLVAAKQVGRPAIGVELEERFCEIAANRLSQGVLDFGTAS